MRDLNENACAVARLGIGADRAPVLQIQQDFQGVLHDLMAFHALNVRDQAEAAGVVFVVGMIEPLRFGKAVRVG